MVEDERAIKTLVIQKYSSVSGPLDRQYFAFVGDEIDVLPLVADEGLSFTLPVVFRVGSKR